MTKFGLLGAPDDLGVKNVFGRCGAAYGPKFFRTYFNFEHCLDFGDITNTHDLEQHYLQVAHGIEKIHNQNLKSILIGGGHDYAYSHLLGLKKIVPKISCINIDAHLDVRPYEPLMTSGSPFRRAIEEGLIEGPELVEFGIQKYANKHNLFQYANQKNIPIYFYESMRQEDKILVFKKALAALKYPVVLSVDLDAVRISDAPGVSAPSVEGFFSHEVIEMIEACRDKILSLGIFELNPLHDHQNQTSRLAARLAYAFTHPIDDFI